MRRSLVVGLAATLVVLALQAHGADDVVTATLTADAGNAAVEMTVAPGWHVNAHEPLDEFLVPTTVTVVPPDGVVAGDVVYPPPVERKLAFGGDRPLRLYSGRVRFTAGL